MNIENLKSLIVNGEGPTVEFKNRARSLEQDVYETVCSFANRDGGYLLFGIDDKSKTLVGVLPELVEKFKQDFVNTVNNPNSFTPVLNYELSEIIVDNKIMLYTYIYPSAEVHKLKGRIYDRRNDSDLDITDTSDLVSSMYLRKKDIYSESKIYPYCTLDMLNENLIEEARKLATIKNSNHPWKNLDNEALLRSAGLYRIDPSSGEKGYTLACILLFGKGETIMSVCPQHRTDCIKRIKNLDRYDDRDDIRTNLIDTYYRMLTFIGKHLDEGFALDPDTTRYSPRDFLFREAIANILIHREYRDRTVATMIIEKDKVVFQNGCIPYRNGKITLENFQPKSKNPTIAKVFNNMGLADELGSGVRNMYKYNRVYSGATPEIIEDDIFKTIIPLMSNEEIIRETLSQEEKIIEFIKTNGKITTSDVRELLNVERTRALQLINKMVENKAIYRYGNGKSTYYQLEV